MPRAPASTLTPATARSVEDLAHDVRRGTYDAKPPAVLAKRVAETLIQVVATADARATLEEIIASVRAIGGSLAVLKREHLLVGNVARRVLRVIRDEGATSERGDDDGGGEREGRRRRGDEEIEKGCHRHRARGDRGDGDGVDEYCEPKLGFRDEWMRGDDDGVERERGDRVGGGVFERRE